MLQFISENASYLVTSGALTLCLLLISAPVAKKISLVDTPNSRKHHTADTPLVGGLCIFTAGLVSSAIFMDATDPFMAAFISCGFLLLSLGVVDDLFDVKAISKLIVQVCIVFLLILSTDFHITSIGNLVHNYPVILGEFSLPVTLIAVVGLTNAFNMIDGCDGLAGGLSLLAIMSSLFIGAEAFVPQFQFFLLLLTANLLVFLLFNYTDNKSLKVFLGDGGSLFLGFIVSITLIQFANGSVDQSPSMVLWFVAVPIFDLCAVIVQRLVSRRNIMVADRSHIHHLLLSMGFSHFWTSITIFALACVLISFGVFIEKNLQSLSPLAFFTLCIVYIFIRLFGHKIAKVASSIKKLFTNNNA